MKKTLTIPVGKIMSAVAMGEGMCACALVDKALKVVPMNPIVKTIGRGAVSTIVAMPFSASAAYLWISDCFNIKVGGEKDSTGKRIDNDDLKDLIKNLEDHDKAYIGVFYKGKELLCIEHINIAVKRGIIDADKGSELCAKIFEAVGATIDHDKICDLVKSYTDRSNSSKSEKDESSEEEKKGEVWDLHESTSEAPAGGTV